MKINDTKFNIGDEVYPIVQIEPEEYMDYDSYNKVVEYLKHEYKYDFFPRKWALYGSFNKNEYMIGSPVDSPCIFLVGKIKVITDGDNQENFILSKTRIERKKLNTKLKNGREISNDVSRKIETEENEFNFENCFYSKEEAEKEIEKRNNIMVYVVRVKGLKKVIYSKDQVRIINFVKDLLNGKEDLYQKFSIEKKEMPLENWINLDISDVEIQIKDNSNLELKVKEDTYRTMESFEIKEEDLDLENEIYDVSQGDELLETFNEIKKASNEVIEKEKDFYNDKEKKDLIEELKLFTEPKLKKPIKRIK
jgi:hypothetical protein